MPAGMLKSLCLTCLYSASVHGGIYTLQSHLHCWNVSIEAADTLGKDGPPIGNCSTVAG